MINKSKKDNLTPITTDEALYEIATIKEDITNNKYFKVNIFLISWK